MATTSTDRRQGVNVGAALKVPCKAATTANITLSAAQTIDGVSIVSGDRVLVKDQTTASENGVYKADSGAWTRDKDWDGVFDVKKGTLAYVTDGTANGNKLFKVTTSDPITPGTTSVTITEMNISVTGLPVTRWCGTAGGTANALTLTPTSVVDSLVAGLTLVFKSGSANTGATTIAVSGLTATAAQSNGQACVGGEIEANKWYRAIYDGAAFQLERVAPAVLLEMLTAKGDIIIGTGTGTTAIKTVGADNTILVADAAQSDGVKWAVLAASDTVPGLIEVATQAEQEAGSDLGRAVTPGRQHLHQSAAKAWVRFNSAGTVAASYNITSITDTGTGDWSVVLATDFSAADAYCGDGMMGQRAGGAGAATLNVDAASEVGTFHVSGIAGSDGATRVDAGTPDEIHVVFYGDQ